MTKRHEQDKVDTSLILSKGTSQHVPQPSTCAQGLDYITTRLAPKTAKSKQSTIIYKKKKVNSLNCNITESTFDRSSSESQSHQKDITKPDGEACNTNGTLRDASEMVWLYSPSADSPSFSFSKRTHSNASDKDEVTLKKKTCVSIKSRAEK